METEDHLFANSNFRVLLGLSSALIIVAVAFLAFEGWIRWMLVGLAAVDAVTTPYLLKMAVENADEETVGQQV